LARLWRQTPDLGRLKMVIGGSELPKALARQALALGVDVYAGYGMSESAPLLCLAQVKSADLNGDPEKAVDIRTKAGIPAPLVEYPSARQGPERSPS